MGFRNENQFIGVMNTRSIIIIFSILFGAWKNGLLHAQSVEFIQHDDLLSSVSGFAEYADCIVDMNGDFRDDVVRIGGKGIFIDYQQKDGSFEQEAFNMPIYTRPSWSICAGDVNRDGLNDLLLAGSTSVSFLVSGAGGTTYQEYLMPGFIECQRSTMFDINNDSWLDAFVCNEDGQSVPYRNVGNGLMMRDSAFLPTVNLPGNYAAIWTDYDNDGNSDLYITKCLAGALPGDPVRTNGLYKNNGDGTFTEVGAAAGVDDNAQSWSTSFEDFDHDGDFDAFVINHDFQNRLYRNNGDGTFTDVITSSGIGLSGADAFENTSADFNNDGHMDIFSDLTNRLYLGNGDMTFTGQNVPTTPGAIGDLNHDGFLDIVHQGHVWLNAGHENHWLNINVFGIQSNQNAIGSRVELYGPWGMQVQEVRSGQSYSPMSSMTVHFGLGENTIIDSLVVRFPSGRVARKLDQFIPDTTFIIPEADYLLPTITLLNEKDTSICDGDTIMLSAPDGYSAYRWSDGAITQEVAITNPGHYFVIAYDDSSHVAVSNIIHISQFIESPPVIETDGSVQFCQGDTLILSVISNQPVEWSTGATSQYIRVTQSGEYTVSAEAVCFNGELFSSPRTVTVNSVPPPVVNDAMLNAGDSILLSATGESIHWYNESGDLLFVGSDFQTPALHTSTTYFVESKNAFGGEIANGGKPDTIGDGGLPAQSGYLLFTTWEPFTIQSVSVFVPEGGPLGVRFVQLRSGDSLLAFKSLDLHPGENILNLDFHVDIGSYILDCPQGNLFRNSANVTYPYAIGQSGVITGSSHGSDYYYYFYDWKIKTDEYTCASERVPVNVIVTGEEFLSATMPELYPNPATSFTTVKGVGISDTTMLELVDIDGRGMKWLYEWMGDQFRMDVSNMKPGVYILRIQNQGQLQLVKLVIL